MNPFLDQLYWREPLWILLVLFPLLVILWRQAQQRQSLRRYADAALLPWILVPDVQQRERWLLASQFLIWLLFGVAAAGPRLLLSAPPDLLPPQGAAVIVIDHSRSMQASDIFPDRLQQAHDTVTRWTQDNNELKLGLVIFAGASHIVLPVTSDKQILQDTASLLNEIQLPTYGSAIVESLQQARSLLQSEPLLANETGARAIIMLTDGDVPQKKLQQLAQIAHQLQQENITLHLLGVGTPSPIALADNDGPWAGRWLQYDGETVVTRLKEAELQKLAESEGVFYSRLTPPVHNELINVWQAEPARIAAQHFDEVLWNELFPWFLIPALLLIILTHLSVPFRISPATKILTIFIITIIAVIQPSPVQANGDDDEHANKAEALQQAYTYWQNENYAAAARSYARIDGYAARMGEGASCFRDKQLVCAVTAFSRAAWEAGTEEQRGQAAFNLANSFFRQGDFKSAITLYKDALRLQPQQVTYQNNLAFSEEVQRNIERRLQQETDSQNAARRAGDGKEINIDNQRVSEMNMVLGDKIDNGQQTKTGALKLSKEQLAYYMQRSQSFARLSSGQAKRAQRQHDWSRFSNENPVAARKVKYWQRLFEMEEDIPAHPDTPKVLPGVQPW